MMPHNGQPTRIRVGMHTGPAVTGLIGTKLPKYSVFGDTMNTASRMESSCPYGCIQISDSTHALLSGHPFKPTGGVEVKGKGRMDTFIWDPEMEPNYTIPPDVAAAIARAKRRASEAGSQGGFKELLPQLFNPIGSTSMIDENSTGRSLSTTSGATPRMSRDFNRSSGQFQSWGEDLSRKSSMSAPQFPPNQHRGKRLSQSTKSREGAIQDRPARALRRMTKSMPARSQRERPSELEALATLNGTPAPSTPDQQRAAPWPNPQHHHRQQQCRHQQPQHRRQHSLQQQEPQHQQQSHQQQHHHHHYQQQQPPPIAPCDERPPESAAFPISIPHSPHSHHSQFLASPPDSSALYKVGSLSQTDFNPLYTSLGSEEATQGGSGRFSAGGSGRFSAGGSGRFSAGPSNASRAGSHFTGLLKALEQESSRPSPSSRSSKPGGHSTPLGRSGSHATAYVNLCSSPSLECLRHSASFNPAASAAAAAESSRSSPLYSIHPQHSQRRNSKSHLNPSHRRSSSRGKSSPLLLLRSPLPAFSQRGSQRSSQQESSGGAASLEALHHMRSSAFSHKSAPIIFLQPSSAAPSQRSSGGASCVAAHAPPTPASLATSRRRASLGSHSGQRASLSGPGAQAARRHPLLGLLLQHTSPTQAELLLHEHTIAQQARSASDLSAPPISPLSARSPQVPSPAHPG
ncbi:hypothetical protein DUNSADRAFT_687 [Dunaliella salina]|uniref:Guanylate cyclase domain-containing protein n=1 Tax=Dunaliella salina TaxID=3046 RepID=A0ABQ7FYJ7_DUNSA|nr:hypothetical protein DUNSADRAFT_687 [Dunaliella salina]|eukprot:KAF5827432.1 hypothetical protein DUNSADRAFT_687 [Dunaliella salina]